MRRAALLLSFAVLLLAAQTAGFLHEIGHGLGGTAARSVAVAVADRAGCARTNRKTASQSERQPVRQHVRQPAPCDKCFQYAQIAGLTTSPVIVSPTPGLVVETASAAVFAWRPALAPTSRSRDPPVAL